MQFTDRVVLVTGATYITGVQLLVDGGITKVSAVSAL
jgi:hypothetical protein